MRATCQSLRVKLKDFSVFSLLSMISVLSLFTSVLSKGDYGLLRLSHLRADVAVLALQ